MEYYAQDELFNRHDLDNLKLKDTAVALGVFDAMHLGHLEIVDTVVRYARENGFRSAVYMFRNIPKSVITNTDIKNVNLFKKRLRILYDRGVDIVIAERFTTDYMKIPYTEFVDKYLVEKFGAKFVCAGFNFHYGFRGKGNTENLRELCAERGIKVHIAECKSLDCPVSSTLIRQLIASGEMEEAAVYLGRYFSVTRRVERGAGLGHRIGFPTANIELPDFHVVPKFGVYITRAKLNGKWHRAVTNVGGKPTVGSDKPSIETYIFGHKGDLYGKEIEIEFRHYLRPIIKFESIDGLKAQRERDKRAATEYFDAEEKKTAGSL